ncbi:delta(14)-sterol reductase [Copidosoma floridanum]|uniref:delta(14)-sterol reductase n=1 Tax=Copidosoma floridanum TaxID=29053 RepID=UPI0006C976CB|nr:delta(14)-sterol reductase [Copidosoma floridanum]XP_014212424.1 delta(14)-sterol reductase [Copidosoma floridanum]
MKFSEGDRVLAKVPSTQEFEGARVISARGGKYKVQFEGGSEQTLGEADVKARRTSRSQTRSKTRVGAKSPTRNSPGRRSPGRRSPARAPNTQSRKLPVRQPRQPKISIPRLEIPKDNSSDTDRTEGSESLKDEFVEPSMRSNYRELGPVTRRSIRIMSNASKAEHDQKLSLLKGADRSASLPAERKYDASSEGKERGFSMQPDDDVLILDYKDKADGDSGEKRKKINLISKPQEWGGWFGALLLILFTPVYALLLQLVCSFNNCKYKNIFNLVNKRDWKSLFDLNAFLMYAGFIAFVAIMSALPIGRLIDGQQTKTGRLQYRINGFWTLLFSISALFGCHYYGYRVDDIIIGKLMPLSVVGLIYGIILSIALYIKAGRIPVSNLNMYAATNNRIYDFWQGKEVNPRVGPLDIKLILMRTALIGTIIVNLAAIFKISEIKLGWSNVDPVAIAVVSLQIIYALDSLIFEASFLSSFEVLYEGTGYMLSLGYLIYPFLTSISIRYLSHHKVQQPLYLQCFFIITFIIGYVVYRLSNHQKDKFRQNPFESSVSKLESIPTKRGKRLIVSGWWGYVRHPNYLGDIIMHWSIAFLCFSTDALPYILAIQTTLLLIHRAVRDNARCQDRYGYAWEQYCSRVKYRIIKGIF